MLQFDWLRAFCFMTQELEFEATATDMRYFAKSTFSRSLVHKKNFSLLREVFFKLGYLFFQEN